MNTDTAAIPSFFVFGNVFYIIVFVFQGFDFYRQRREMYGHVYKTHVLGKPTIRIWGTENIRKVLKNEETLVTMSWPSSVTQLMGKGGLITSTRKLHSNRRSAVMKAFTSSAINGRYLYNIWLGSSHTLFLGKKQNLLFIYAAGWPCKKSTLF